MGIDVRKVPCTASFLMLAAVLLPALVSLIQVVPVAASFTVAPLGFSVMNTDNATTRRQFPMPKHLPPFNPQLAPAEASRMALSIPGRVRAGAPTLDDVYVNGAIGSDSYDGSSPAVVSGSVGPKKTVQGGADAANEFGIVHVAAGTYRENVIIEGASIWLNGAGARETIIDGGASSAALTVVSSSNEVLLTGFTVRNGASPSGGGVLVIDSQLWLEDCAVTGNRASAGGGICSISSLLVIDRCSISGNVADQTGGGILNLAGVMLIADSTISGNTAGVTGGGICNSGPPSTGMEAYFITLANNSAPGAGAKGGGFANQANALSFWEGCIVADNTAVFPGAGNAYLDPGAESLSDGHNIDSENTCGFTDSTDQVNVKPRLGPLRDNDGPTFTHGIGADSPAFDRGGQHGDLFGLGETDQRGVSRPQGAFADVGAYELILRKTAATGTANGGRSVSFSTSAGGIVDLASSATCSGGNAGLAFPFGLFSFRIVGIVPGSMACVSITFPQPVSANLRYMQCDGRGNWTDITSLVGSNDGDNVLVLNLTDGGLGDLDHPANGRIVDPAGPCYRVAAAQSSSPYIAPPQQAVALPGIQVQRASLSTSAVTPGSPVTVTALLTNTGAVNGNFKLSVYVNGQEEAGRGVVVERGSLIPVIFTVSRSEPGTYSVYVGGVNAGSFTVNGDANPDVVLFVSFALVLMALAGAVIYVYRRRQLS